MKKTEEKVSCLYCGKELDFFYEYHKCKGFPLVSEYKCFGCGNSIRKFGLNDKICYPCKTCGWYHGSDIVARKCADCEEIIHVDWEGDKCKKCLEKEDSN